MAESNVVMAQRHPAELVSAMASLEAAGIVIPPINSLTWAAWDTLKAGIEDRLDGRPFLKLAFERAVVPFVEAELASLVGPRP